MGTAKCFFSFEVCVGRDYRCEAHLHPCTEVVLCRGCQGSVWQEEKQAQYADGVFYVHQPEARHGINNQIPGSQLCIGLSGCGSEQIPFGVYPATAPIRSLMEQIEEESAHPGAYREEYLDLLAGQLAILILRGTQPAPEQSVEPYHAREAKRILDTRFAEELNINDLAAELQISPDYLRQQFRDAYGEAPLHYLLRRRVDHACYLLSTGNDTHCEIARRCGIDNPYYFSRVFKKVIGMTPSAYTKHYQNPDAGPLQTSSR